jgi:hypothetical protein
MGVKLMLALAFVPEKQIYHVASLLCMYYERELFGNNIFVLFFGLKKISFR